MDSAGLSAWLFGLAVAGSLGFSYLVYRKTLVAQAARYLPPSFRHLRFFRADGSPGWTVSSAPPAIAGTQRQGTLTSTAAHVEHAAGSPRVLDVAAIADGLLASAAQGAALAATTSPVLAESIQRLGLDFAGAAALDSHLDSLPETARIGYQAWLEGHVGETLAAHALAAGGHDVVFAATPNQPGWDLLVDGEPVNVKVGEHALHSVHEHLSTYPDIDVYTDLDTAAAIDSPDVHGLTELDADHVESALAATDAAPGLFEFHFPVVTAIASIAKEASISGRFGFALGEFIASVGSDVASVGVGSAIGAGIGSLLLPGLGTVAGGALGAWIGRQASRNLKHELAREATEAFGKGFKEFETRVASAMATASAEVETIVARWQRELEAQTAPARERLASRQQAVDHRFARDLVHLAQLFVVALNTTLAELDRERAQVRSMWGRPPWIRLLFPRLEDLLHDKAMGWLDEQSSRLRSATFRLESEIASQELDGLTVERVAGLRASLDAVVCGHILEAPEYSEPAARAAGFSARAATELDAAWRECAAAVMPVRDECASKASSECNVVWDRAKAPLGPEAATLREQWQGVCRAAARAGSRVEQRDLVAYLGGFVEAAAKVQGVPASKALGPAKPRWAGEVG